jgi:hypothetical protein
MLEEVLEISPYKVCVKYRFLNDSDQGIQTTVAFPLPPQEPIMGYYISRGEPAMVLSTFKLRVDGNPRATRHERKAVVGNSDITAELRKLNLADKEIFFQVSYDDLDLLLEKLKNPRQKFGNWRIAHTLYWEMTFPAHRETIVEHEYEPGAGGGWTMIPFEEGFEKDFEERIANLWGSFTGKYQENEDCPDETTKRAIVKQIKREASKGEKSVGVSYRSVEYILGTGRNWKGPIGEFKLRLVKGKPDQLVSLCFPGKPEKISPTTYEFVQKDFVPPDKLVVYFYAVNPDAEFFK